MLHDVIILIPCSICFSIFFHKNHKNTGTIFFHPGGNFDIDAGDGGDQQTLKKFKKTLNTCFFSIFFPQKGTLTLTPGMGWGVGEHVGPPKSQQIHKHPHTSSPPPKKTLKD